MKSWGRSGGSQVGAYLRSVVDSTETLIEGLAAIVVKVTWFKYGHGRMAPGLVRKIFNRVTGSVGSSQEVSVLTARDG